MSEHKLITADYIWLDGNKHTQKLRSKCKVLSYTGSISLDSFEEWGFDGSSTYQSEGGDSDLILKPVSYYPNPVRGGESYVVMCEVLNPDGSPHPTNTRALLRSLLENGADKEDPWIGFEQEYTFFKEGRPLGWPAYGFPEPQGPFYCSVGANLSFGRDIVEEHMAVCLEAGIMIFGTNAEVMPGQWEYQIGYRGNPTENANVLKISDEAWISRYLLKLISEEYGIHVSFAVKPVKGNWNGAGMHTNFSTLSTRNSETGMKAIEEAIKKLSKAHVAHIEHYGSDNHMRLTGDYETSKIDEFRSGVADRGASIRIPRSVANKGHGYFEDRRPGANANPYDVAYMLVKTVVT